MLLWLSLSALFVRNTCIFPCFVSLCYTDWLKGLICHCIYILNNIRNHNGYGLVNLIKTKHWLSTADFTRAGVFRYWFPCPALLPLNGQLFSLIFVVFVTYTGCIFLLFLFLSLIGVINDCGRSWPSLYIFLAGTNRFLLSYYTVIFPFRMWSCC